MESLGKVFAPSDPAFIQDPYRYYSILRERDPIHQSDFGFWVFTRHADVAAALNDRRFSNKPAPFATVNVKNSTRYVCASVANNLIAFMDPPDHTEPRRLIASAFVRYLKGKEASIANVAERLYASWPSGGEIDYFRDFSVPFATECTSLIMGFPPQDSLLLERWSSLLFYLFHSIPSAEVLDQVNRGLQEFREYVRDQIQIKRRSPKDDLLTLLCQSAQQKKVLNDQQMIDNCMLLTADGIQNVQAGLATALATLLQHPDQLAKLLQNPDLMPAAVEECLRYESPGQYQGRITTETIKIGGKAIRAQSIVLLVLASANRDERVFSYPNQFLIERAGPRHLAFGLGNHACIGGALVAMEFRCALRSLFTGSRKTALMTDRLSWTTRAGHRWPAALPLRIKTR
jgi:pimeloyl-[acyl-carrier protein] synthase